MTSAQKWAKNRNWMKYQIRGMYVRARSIGKSKFCTVTERQRLKTIASQLNEIIKNWDLNNEESKTNYLKG